MLEIHNMQVFFLRSEKELNLILILHISDMNFKEGREK